MSVALGLLPFLGCALVAYALRPARPVVAPLRLAVIRAALLVGGYAVVLVEVLSAFHALTRPAVLLAWSVGLIVALGAAGARRRADGHGPAPVARLRRIWAGAGRAERVMALALLGMLLVALAIALISPPNNFDSQTYHLPKIEHWVARHDVTFFQTPIHRQLTLAPGAEYLLLHLRLLTGGDALYNLSQLSAGVGCALLASRIAGQLGGSRRAQLLAAFVVGTTPLVALEATSTQTDLVVAAWVACAATLILDELRRRSSPAAMALLGVAVGLTGLTKATGLLAVGPLLIVWGIAQLRRARRARQVAATAAGSVLIIAVGLALFGPYIGRVTAEYGSPLGPSYLTGSISMQRHDPAAIGVNALRIGHTALNTPVPPLNRAAAAGIDRLARGAGVDANDPAITFPGSRFPFFAWAPDEDRASFPVAGILVLLGAAFLLARPGRRVPADRTGVARAYAAVFWVTLLLHVSSVKWQPWGNRLVLFILVLGAPLAALWLDAVLSRRAPGPAPAEASPASDDAILTGDEAPTAGALRDGPPARRFTVGPPKRRRALAAVVLVLAGCSGAIAVTAGWPRRLIGPHSILTSSDMQLRFARRPQWRAGYEWAAAAVRAAGARRVGLVEGNDSWEYPWWVLLHGDTIVALQNAQPYLPTARPASVDAILCVSSAKLCASYTPAGWAVHMRGTIGYALPPRAAAAPSTG